MNASIFSDDRYVLEAEIILGPEGPLRNHALAVDTGAIAAVDEATLLKQRYRGWPVHSLPGRALIPGFVDAHIHLGQGFGKGITFGEPSQIWQRIWIPLEKMLTPELCYISAKWMFLEALRGGYTTLCDFAIINADKARAIHRAAIDTGVRLVSCTGSVDRADYPNVTGVTPKFEPIEAAIRRAEDHLALCRNQARITPSICVSGVQAASPELMRASYEFCERHDIMFQIHANEHHPEVHACVVLHGKRPIHHIADSGALGPRTLVHHAAIVSASEVGLLQSAGAAVSYNPVASQWKVDAIAPALEFADRGIRMGLGTDSTRSDAFRMLDAAENCQRAVSGMRVMDFSCGAGWTWVDAATRGGADACGLGKLTGQLAAGFRADFLVLDMNAPEVQPSWDFEWELVRLYSRDRVETVVVDGKPVMAGGRAIGWDQDEFLRESLPKAVAMVKGSDLVRRHGSSIEHRARRQPGRPAST
ncbi:MAG: amidohydrolase [Betaproteobacteria bacterium]|nr:amidohydrolase [Betaproteobacteria bacterium]